MWHTVWWHKLTYQMLVWIFTHTQDMCNEHGFCLNPYHRYVQVSHLLQRMRQQQDLWWWLGPWGRRDFSSVLGPEVCLFSKTALSNRAFVPEHPLAEAQHHGLSPCSALCTASKDNCWLSTFSAGGEEWPLGDAKSCWLQNNLRYFLPLPAATRGV